MLLHNTADHTTLKYRQNYMYTQHTQTMQVSHTQSEHIDMDVNNLHTKLM